MTDISSSALSALGLTSYESQQSASGNSSDLGQSEFLKLMTTQLANQDPLSPMENGDFIGQLAQFSTVTGIEELSSSFETLAQSLGQWQAMQGVSLVGNDVLVPAETGTLEAEQSMRGAVSLPSSATGVSVEIYDTSGQLVRTLDLGAQASGLRDFEWDGLVADGSRAPAGRYELRATATIDGESEAVATLLSGSVNSVALNSGGAGLRLTVNGIGEVGFDDVSRIG